MTQSASPSGEYVGISIVVPVFNESDALPFFHREIVKRLDTIGLEWEVIYIDDGSTDRSRDIIKRFSACYSNISLLSFSRNFGKESAMSAGLKISQGQAVVIMDADLQDPPSVLPEMVNAWQNGADIVNMRRRCRLGESWLKKVTARSFYYLINRISDIDIPEGIGDFRLLSRRVVDALNQMPEANRFMKGLFSWVGYRQTILDFDRDPRIAGKTKWNYWKLWNFALEGITSFSTAPLKIATYTGFLSAMGAFLYALYFLVKTLIFGDSTPGFPTLIITVLVLGGIQLMAIGILGEYVGRLFIQAKQRPAYFVDEYLPARRFNKTSFRPEGLSRYAR